ncbi:MAG: cadmium-translocating P-type ATPase [Clostridia bacterium]|nr:cadmium-translocating P-type ATPase [Clostridia bacterium]
MRIILNIKGLDCAGCAAELEAVLAKVPGVTFAKIDYPGSRLILEGETTEKATLIAAIRQAASDSLPQAKVLEEQTKTAANSRLIIRIAIAAALYLAALLATKAPQPLPCLLYVAAYAVAGGGVLLKALRNLTRGRVFDENLLMSIATIGALAIGAYAEAVAVMLFYRVGEFFEHHALAKSRGSIADLMDLRPDYANVRRDGQLLRIDPEEVQIGDIIMVLPGEKIPFDARVLNGHSLLDTSPLTGEALPREVGPGDEIISGCLNLNGSLTAEVLRAYHDSTVSKILDLVEKAGRHKAAAENFITRFARWYTPAVVLAAALLAILPPLLLAGAAFQDWLYRALVLLVISCPCALVLSVPLSFFCGIGRASRSGVLIKGGNYLEALARTQTVVFDKTGTLTQGRFKVRHIETHNIGEDELLALAAHAESHSSHPLALSLRQAYGGPINADEISEVEESRGLGVAATVQGRRVLAGSSRWLRQHGIALPPGPAESNTIVQIAVDGNYAGAIHIADQPKEDAAAAISALKRLGIKQTVLLTGDNAGIGNEIGRALGLDAVHSELLPGDKVAKLEELLQAQPPQARLAFVGDGINDAPALARADIGIAMGGLGSDAAIEAADIVVMTDVPSKIAAAITISRRTLAIVRQNIFFILGVKLTILLLGALGMATMWSGVFADIGVALITILNATRILAYDR